MNALDVVAAALLLTGCALAAVSGIGLVRFPDVLSRMHAATKPITLGLLLVGAATILRLDELRDVTLLVSVVFLQFLTAPVGAHLVGRAVIDTDPQGAGQSASDAGDEASPSSSSTDGGPERQNHS